MRAFEFTETKQRLDPKCWKGYKKQGTKIKGGVRVNNCVKEDAPSPKKVGREFNHLEDLIFTEPNGGNRAIKILQDIAQDSSDVTIKWDGSPTVYWGRDEDGTFRLVGKNNWGREEGKSSSPDELEAFINSRGKGEEWRPRFAKEMAAMWDIFEQATPKDFRGYVYGDILFHPGKPYSGKDGKIHFTPNQTTYSVNVSTDVGRRLANTKIAVAAHKKLDYFGDKGGEELKELAQFNGTNDLVVFGQTYVSHQPAVNADNLAVIEKEVRSNQASINQFLTPIQGLSDLQNIIYTYVNSRSKDKALDSIDSDDFFNWLKTSKVSAPKQEKIFNHPNAEVLGSLFFIVRELMKAKNEVIGELDKADGPITANTNGTPGGEGYVHGKHGVKLVQRDRWTPFRSE